MIYQRVTPTLPPLRAGSQNPGSEMAKVRASHPPSSATEEGRPQKHGSSPKAESQTERGEKQDQLSSNVCLHQGTCLSTRAGDRYPKPEAGNTR